MNETNTASVGERICSVRQAAGLTQEQLANRLQINRATLSKYENGEIVDIPIRQIERIAAELHVPPTKLVGWKDTTECPNRSDDTKTLTTALFREIQNLCLQKAKDALIDPEKAAELYLVDAVSKLVETAINISAEIPIDK